jgi:heme/copper-type cytochrome/quinol oxidase subunit 2
MGSQKLGLGKDSSFDSEDNLERARIEDTAEQAVRFTNSPFRWIIVAFGLAVVCFLIDWGGYRGKMMPWGDPRPLAEVWWHFPVFFVILLGFFRLLVFLDKRF